MQSLALSFPSFSGRAAKFALAFKGFRTFVGLTMSLMSQETYADLSRGNLLNFQDQSFVRGDYKSSSNLLRSEDGLAYDGTRARDSK